MYEGLPARNMMTATERTHAICEACGQGYSVPDEDRTYTCKLCQGLVRVPGHETGQHGHLVGALDCANCHAINHAGTHVCVECGEDLDAEPEDSDPLEDSRARRKATHELRHGYKWIGAFRWICRAGALGYALVTLTAILAMARSEIPYEPGLLVIALSTLLTILMLMGAVQILFKPFVWTLIIALAASAAAVVHLMGPNPLGLAFGWSLFWAALFWIAISPTLRFRKLVDAHTDLYILQQSTQRTRRRIESGDSGHRHERLLRVMRNASRRAWRISAAIAVGATLLSTAATFIVVSQVRPIDFDETVESFEEAWPRASDVTLRAYFAPETRAWQGDRLFGFADGHGWGRTFPPLVRDDRVGTENQVEMKYELGDFPVSMNWVRRERNWFLLNIQMPIPPFDPSFQRFLGAWKRSDTKALSEFFAPDFRERMQVSLKASLTNRGWTSFPEISSFDLDTPEPEKCVATLQVESGAVITTWWISPRGDWALQTIVFPKPVKKPRQRPR